MRRQREDHYSVTSEGGYYDGTTSYSDDGGATEDDAYALPTDTECLAPVTDTGSQHLTGTADLRADGVETGHLSVSFQMQIPLAPLTQAGAAGFPVFRLGSPGNNGTITIKYMPVQGAPAGAQHMLVATVDGDAARTATCPLTTIRAFFDVYLEYDGQVLTLAAGSKSDQCAASTVISPAPSPAQLLFGADCKGMYFRHLAIYNQAMTATENATSTGFPYMLWDSSDSGVIAVIPTPETPADAYKRDHPTAEASEVFANDYYVFIDRGYSAGYQPAVLDLGNVTGITQAVLYVNDAAVATLTGTTSAAIKAALVSAGTLEVAWDGKRETITISDAGGTSIALAHRSNGITGRLSFCAGIKGVANGAAISSASWGGTVACLGKIPPPFAHPHTGEPNKAVSILGTNRTIATPQSLTVDYRDDDVITCGKVIGDVNNRPAAGMALTRLSPSNFFGSAAVPFPDRTIVYGDPNALSSELNDNSIYAYGLVWERFLSMSPEEIMRRSPANRSRSGYPFAAFSIDIPIRQTLRGVDICFTAPPPALRGNVVTDPGFVYDWGEGTRQFPMTISGSSDYTCLFYILICTDSKGKTWVPLPSLGADAVKVAGATEWKTITFKSVDYDTLKDVDGLPLLRGGRRVLFKLVLAQELSSVTAEGLSYRTQSNPKK